MSKVKSLGKSHRSNSGIMVYEKITSSAAPSFISILNPHHRLGIRKYVKNKANKSKVRKSYNTDGIISK